MKKQRKTRISNKMICEMVERVSFQQLPPSGGSTEPSYYRSTLDGSIICNVGLSAYARDQAFNFYWLISRGITEHIQHSGNPSIGELRYCNMGFNPVKGEWYGWTRTGQNITFGIGSKSSDIRGDGIIESLMVARSCVIQWHHAMKMKG